MHTANDCERGRHQSGTVGSDPGDLLNNPTGAMIGNGKLVVVDQTNNRVLVWNMPSTLQGIWSCPAAPLRAWFWARTISAVPIRLFSSTTLTNSNSTIQKIAFTTPSDVWTNGADLFVSDTGNNRVLYWPNIPTTNIFAAQHVVGQTLFTRTQEGASAQVMNGPIGVTADGNGNFSSPITQNNRVLQFSGFPVSDGQTAATVFGQQDFTHTAYNDDDQNGTRRSAEQSDNTFPTEIRCNSRRVYSSPMAFFMLQTARTIG